MRVCVIDGRGGGLGRRLVEGLRGLTEGRHELLAMGITEAAAEAMARAGAAQVVVGRPAIVRAVREVDLILASVSLILLGAWQGAVTSDLARAVLLAPARKLLLPVNGLGIEIVGAATPTLEAVIAQALRRTEAVLRTPRPT